MDHAHLLQRPRRNLQSLVRRSSPAPRSSSAASPLRRPPVPSPRQHHHPHLHRRLPLLRHKSLARLPHYPAPHLIFVGAQHAAPQLGNTCAAINVLLCVLASCSEFPWPYVRFSRSSSLRSS